MWDRPQLYLNFSTACYNSELISDFIVQVVNCIIDNNTVYLF